MLLAVLLVGLSLAGCGDGGSSEPGAVGEAASPGETQALPTDTQPSPTRRTTPPSEALAKIRVVGEVLSIGDCTVLRDDNDITWTLVPAGAGGELSPSVGVGDRIRATGSPDLSATGCGGPVVRTVTITVID